MRSLTWTAFPFWVNVGALREQPFRSTGHPNLLADFIVIQHFLNRLLTYRLKDFEIAHHAEIPAQPPIFGKLSTPLPGPVGQAMLKLGITAQVIDEGFPARGRSGYNRVPARADVLESRCLVTVECGYAKL